MPINEHEMENMKDEYGKKKGEEVYYATECHGKCAKEPSIHSILHKMGILSKEEKDQAEKKEAYGNAFTKEKLGKAWKASKALSAPPAVEEKKWASLSFKEQTRALKETGSNESEAGMTLAEIGGSTADVLMSWMRQMKKESPIHGSTLAFLASTNLVTGKPEKMGKAELSSEGSKLKQLWESSTPPQEIAKKMGYSSTDEVYAKVMYLKENGLMKSDIGKSAPGWTGNKKPGYDAAAGKYHGTEQDIVRMRMGAIKEAERLLNAGESKNTVISRIASRFALEIGDAQDVVNDVAADLGKMGVSSMPADQKKSIDPKLNAMEPKMAKDKIPCKSCGKPFSASGHWETCPSCTDEAKKSSMKKSFSPEIKKKLDDLVRHFDDFTTSDLQGAVGAIAMQNPGEDEDEMLSYIYEKTAPGHRLGKARAVWKAYRTAKAASQEEKDKEKKEHPELPKKDTDQIAEDHDKLGKETTTYRGHNIIVEKYIRGWMAEAGNLTSEYKSTKEEAVADMKSFLDNEMGAGRMKKDFLDDEMADEKKEKAKQIKLGKDNCMVCGTKTPGNLCPKCMKKPVGEMGKAMMPTWIEDEILAAVTKFNDEQKALSYVLRQSNVQEAIVDGYTNENDIKKQLKQELAFNKKEAAHEKRIEHGDCSEKKFAQHSLQPKDYATMEAKFLKEGDYHEKGGLLCKYSWDVLNACKDTFKGKAFYIEHANEKLGSEYGTIDEVEARTIDGENWLVARMKVPETDFTKGILDRIENGLIKNVSSAHELFVDLAEPGNRVRRMSGRAISLVKEGEVPGAEIMNIKRHAAG